jgi:hypothetical protein
MRTCCPGDRREVDEKAANPRVAFAGLFGYRSARSDMLLQAYKALRMRNSRDR